MDEWAKDYCQTGQSQSPIDIPTEDAEKTELPKLNLESYQNTKISKLTLTNNGHTVAGTLTETIEISGGPMGEDTYKLIGFHFHFGKGNNDGTEHAIGGQKEAIEVGEGNGNALDFLINALPKIQNNKETTVVENIQLNTLIPGIDVGFEYYTYSGSLTTPNCNEAVTWIVNAQTLTITDQQVMTAIRNVANMNVAITSNYNGECDGTGPFMTSRH